MERLELCFGSSFQSLVPTSILPLQEDLCHPRINIFNFSYAFFSSYKQWPNDRTSNDIIVGDGRERFMNEFKKKFKVLYLFSNY